MVERVVEGSPADRAGIRVGDIIVSVSGMRLEEGEQDLAGALLTKNVGDSIEVEIRRGNETITLRATLAPAPEQ